MFAGGFLGGLAAVLLLSKSVAVLLVVSVLGGVIAAWLYSLIGQGEGSAKPWADVWRGAMGMSWVSMSSGLAARIIVDKLGLL
jgi:hypothetical protein